MKQSIKTITLKKLLSSAVVIIILLIALISYNFQSLTITTMKDKGTTVAQLVETGLLSHFLINNKESKDAYKDSIKKIPVIKELSIIRADIVSDQFDLPSHKDRFDDTIIEKAFRDKEANYEVVDEGKYKDMMRVTFPYVASKSALANCLACHDVEEGSVLGAVDFYIDLAQYKDMSKTYLYIILALLSILLLGILYLIFNIIDRHIKEPLEELIDTTRESSKTHKDIDTNRFESLELEDLALEVNNTILNHKHKTICLYIQFQ